MSPAERRKRYTPAQEEVLRRIAFGFMQFDRTYREKTEDLARIGRVNVLRISDWIGGPCEIIFGDQAPFRVYAGEVEGTGLSKTVYQNALQRRPESIRWKKLDDEEIIRLARKLSRTKDLDVKKIEIPMPARRRP